MVAMPSITLELEEGQRANPPTGLDTRKDSAVVGISNPTEQDTHHDRKSHLLIVSPYDEEPHLLDLRTLDSANQLLAKALLRFKCLRDDYATAPYVDTFNWPEIIDSVQKLAAASEYKWIETSFYIVVFRSRIPPTTIYSDLGVLDKAAHAEATESGGFLK